MKITQVVKKSVKPFLNVSSWMGYQQLADATKSFVSSAKSLFIPAKPTREESFEQATQRFNLTEQQLEQRALQFKKLCLFFFILGMAVIGYDFYLLWHRSWFAATAGFALALICFAQTFRYHFWLFQIRSRKLGCTFREWLDSTFTGNSQ